MTLSPSDRKASPIARLLSLPASLIARAMLAAFLESGWLYSLALIGVAMGFLLFWRPGGATYIFTTAAFAYGLLAFATAALLTRALRSDDARQRHIYDFGPIAYLRGLALAMGIVQSGAIVLLLAALLGFHRMQETSAGMLIAGATGLLVNCVAFGIVVALLLSTMTQTRGIIALAWLVAALWSFSAHGLLRYALAVARLPLIPFGTLYNAGASGDFGWRGALATLCEAVIVAFLLWVTPHIDLPRREPNAVAE